MSAGNWAAGEVEMLKRRVDTLEARLAKLEAPASAAGDTEALLTMEEKKSQAARCACHGSDDYCPCQNVADRATLLQRKRALTNDT